MPLILPGNVGSATAATGFNVANSCRFNRADSTDMTLSMSSGGSQTKFTKSFWVKRCKIGEQHYIYDNSGTTQIFFHFRDSDKIGFGIFNSGAYSTELISTQLFRDLSAWYHIVIAVDYTNGTQALRARIYVNGTEITAFDTETRPGNTSTTFDTFNSDKTHYIGSNASSNHYLHGYLAEVVHIDNAQLAPTSFGEFDSDSGIWKPIDVSGLTFGTKGYYLDFEASGNLGNDANGGTDWTENNFAATDQSTDTCTNNFAIMNPLDNFYAAHSFAEGNTKVSTSTSTTSFSTATIGLSTGKWYFEGTVRTIMGEEGIGVSPVISTADDDYPGKATDSVSYKGNNGNVRKSNSNAAYGNAYVNNNVIGVALNLDDNEIKFYLNGTVQNSDTAVALTAAASTPNGVYFPMVGDGSTDSVGVWEVNFGAGSFTALSSAVADGNGFGAFEYAPPSGFLAICTKNLAESG